MAAAHWSSDQTLIALSIPPLTNRSPSRWKSIDKTCCSVLQCVAVCCSVLQCATILTSLTRIHTRTHTRAYTHSHMRTYTFTCVCIRTHMHPWRTPAHANAHTHTYTCTHTHTRTCTHPPDPIHFSCSLAGSHIAQNIFTYRSARICAER